MVRRTCALGAFRHPTLVPPLWTAAEAAGRDLAGSPYLVGRTPVRPLLKPALRRLWRDPQTLQLGVGPQRAMVVAGVDVSDVGILHLLDGRRELDELVGEAARQGHPPERVRRLVEVLSNAAAIDDAAAGEPHDVAGNPRLEPDLLSLSLVHPEPGAAAAVLAARRGAVVEVVGGGRVGASVLALLAAAGVGAVSVVDDRPVTPADLAASGVRALRSPAGRLLTREAAGRATAAAVAAWPAERPSAPRQRGEQPPVVVLAPAGSVIRPESLRRARGRPHLAAVIRETTAVVGPFVVPGRTACLRCVELARGERDPAWPTLAAQLIGAGRQVEPCDGVLATLAAALAALQVLAWIDAGPLQPPALGATLEFELTDLRLRRRVVSPHPACGCAAC